MMNLEFRPSMLWIGLSFLFVYFIFYIIGGCIKGDIVKNYKTGDMYLTNTLIYMRKWVAIVMLVIYLVIVFFTGWQNTQIDEPVGQIDTTIPGQLEYDSGSNSPDVAKDRLDEQAEDLVEEGQTELKDFREDMNMAEREEAAGK